ncbi:molybdate ABC transporter permease subunit [bacterium]|nr:molybdate ABC transporter permease subunit [bacterium]
MRDILFNLIISLLSGIFMCLIVLPLVALFTTTSWSELAGQFKSPLIVSAVIISFQTSLAVLLAALVFGLPVAYLLAMKNFPGKEILDTLIDLPICMPPLVAGLGLLILLGGESKFGVFLNSRGVDLIFSKPGIVMAQLFVAGPFLIKSSRQAFEAVNKNVTQASRCLGASEFHTFRKVLLPLARNGIYAGMIMTWARALGEFGATSMVAGCIPGRTETMTQAIFGYAMSGEMGSSIAIALLLIVFSFTSLLVFKSRIRKQLPGA